MGRVFALGSFIQASCLYVPGLPAPGASLQATALHRDAGGKGFNLAVGASRLGAQVHVLMAVGADGGEAVAREAMARERLPADGLLVLGKQTGQGFGFVASNGENFLAVFPGANSLVGARHVQAQAVRIREADLVCATFESPDEAILEVFSIARAAGVRTLLNPSPWRLPSPELLAVTDTLILNACEVAELGLKAPLSKLDVPSLAESQLPETLQCLVVTQGAEGVICWEREAGYMTHPGFPITPVDTVGAGDAFAAAFLVAVAAGRSWPDVLAESCAAGAMACLKQGVFEALPDRQALKQWMAAHKAD